MADFLDDVFGSKDTGAKTEPKDENPDDPLESVLGPISPEMDSVSDPEPSKPQKRIPIKRQKIKKDATTPSQPTTPKAREPVASPKKTGGHFKTREELGEIKSVSVVHGGEGCGKTTFGLSSPGPHYIIETEGGHNLVTAQKTDVQYMAAIIEDNSDAKPSQKWFSTAFGLWDQFEDMVNELCDAPPGYVLIDSGSDLLAYQVADRALDWDRGELAFPSMLYGQVYGVIGSNINKLRSRHHVILTARHKDEYKNNERTGKEKLDLWRQGVYLAENVVRMEVLPDDTRLYKVEKGPLMNSITTRLTWEDFIGGNKEDYAEETKSYLEQAHVGQLVKQIHTAYKALDKQSKDLKKRQKEPAEVTQLEDETLSQMSADQLNELLETLREVYNQNNAL